MDRMKKRPIVRATRGRLPAILLAALLAALGAAGNAVAAPPAPCSGTPEISDPINDGHHPGTDVVSAWFSEDAGHLQVVIKVRAGIWVPEHTDAEINGSAYAFLFTIGSSTKYVRLLAAQGGALTYDYGTYTVAGGFATAGATTGEVVYAALNGTATIDVPAATGATATVLLEDPFVLTYDGITDGEPDWVDHGPGGTSPTDSTRGADYVVGSCTVVQLQAPAKLKGGGKKATVTGTILPAQGGVDVALTREAHTTVVSHVLTAADGSFSFTIPVHETTRLRAVAQGISSQTRTVTVYSTVRISAKRLPSGARRITGRVSPMLPGKLLLLRTTAFKAAQTTTKIVNGRFTFTISKRAKPGRFQVVYIPRGKRAERSTSNTVRVR